MEEMSGRNAETTTLQPTSLKQYLLEAAKSSSLTTETLPKSIDFEIFGLEGEKLIQLSIADPDHPEYVNIAFADQYNRILLLKKAVRGEAVAVSMPEYKDKRRLLPIHSHGDVDNPFAPVDLESLFLAPEDPFAAAGVMLVTRSIKMLLLRTKDTPVFSDPYLILDITIEMAANPAMDEEGGLMGQMYEQAGGDNLPLDATIPFTKEGLRELEKIGHKRMSALLNIVQKYHLALFSCSIDKNTGTPVQ